MTGAGAFAIVCAGGGPRAAAALRARFPDVPFRYAGPAASAPYGVLADPSPAAALRAVEAEFAIVADPAVLLHPAAARSLLDAAAAGMAVAPVLLEAGGCVAGAGTVLAADPVRGRAVAHAVARGAELKNVRETPAPDALDGRCVAGRTETLRLIAPEECGADAWLAATAAARTRGVVLAIAPVTVGMEGAAVRQDGDDPRRAGAQSALLAHASPPWAAFAADAVSGNVRRTVRAPYGNDVHVVESAPRAIAVVAGIPADRDGFERALRANALPLDDVMYADGPDAVAVANCALLNRGDRYVAFADARTVLRAGWLDALANALENDPFAAFATLAPHGCDARATLVAAH
ncbi:MAG: hypothetical protein JWM87_3122, partial [Candidatus Eremiobacteraeota bacterium]|nr:hypothetical protein [Candidatus Eremiobacteraeota bacterium]